jgi:hypothetical protein
MLFLENVPIVVKVPKFSLFWQNFSKNFLFLVILIKNEEEMPFVRTNIKI